MWSYLPPIDAISFNHFNANWDGRSRQRGGKGRGLASIECYHCGTDGNDIGRRSGSIFIFTPAEIDACAGGFSGITSLVAFFGDGGFGDGVLDRLSDTGDTGDTDRDLERFFFGMCTILEAWKTRRTFHVK